MSVQVTEFDRREQSELSGRRSIRRLPGRSSLTALPEMLAGLLASEVYGIDRRPPKGQRGVYLFTERGKHLYVGRTSITARSRARGGQPITSFRHPL